MSCGLGALEDFGKLAIREVVAIVLEGVRASGQFESRSPIWLLPMSALFVLASSVTMEI